MKPNLIHLLAAAQLAEMAYNADQDNEHKKAAWDKAQGEYEQAAADQRQEITVAIVADAGQAEKDLELLQKIVDELDRKSQELNVEKETLANQLQNVLEQNQTLYNENLLLNRLLVEKSQKIDELQKLAPAGAPVSGDPATTATAPAVETPAAAVELTPHQKGLQTRAANLAKAQAAATELEADDTKKNN